MEHYVGSLWLLANLPIWVSTSIFLAVVLVPMFVGRDRLEGVAYQVSYSAQIGDAGLLLIMLIAAGVLQRPQTTIPFLLDMPAIHGFVGMISAVVGIVFNHLTIESRDGKLMDYYHDEAIMPLFIYLAVTLLPVICVNGTLVEQSATVLFALLWFALVVFDIKQDRMNQRRWLMNRGLRFKK